MRLALQFSPFESKDLQPGDCVLMANPQLFGLDVACSVHSIHDFPVSESVYTRRLDQARQALVEKLPASLGRVVEASFTNFYNNSCRDVIKWAHAISVLLERESIQEVVLSDGFTRDIGYLPYYEAEGEVSKQRLYKPYDFIPAVLIRWLQKEHPEVKITVLRLHHPLPLSWRIFLRRYGFLHFKLLWFGLYFAWRQVKLLLRGRQRRGGSPAEIVFCSRSLAHTHYMEPILEQLGSQAQLLASDGLLGRGVNERYCRERLPQTEMTADHVTLPDLMRCYGGVVANLVQSRHYPIEIEIQPGLSLNFRSGIREILISWLDISVYESSLRRYFQSTPEGACRCIVTAEMLTAYPYVVARWAEERKIRSLQLQTTLLQQWPQTRFAHCDKFLFRNQVTLDYFRSLAGADPHDRLAYWGHNGRVAAVRQARFPARVLYFTQPYENDAERDLVELIRRTLPDSELYLKLHPRDALKTFPGCPSLNVLSAQANFKDYIENFDLCILRTSSIAEEVIIAGVPILFCLFSGFDRSIKADYILESYQGVCSSPQEVREALSNYQHLTTDFRQHRESFLKRSRFDQDLGCLVSRLRDYVAGSR